MYRFKNTALRAVLVGNATQNFFPVDLGIEAFKAYALLSLVCRDEVLTPVRAFVVALAPRNAVAVVPTGHPLPLAAAGALVGC